MIAHFVSLLQFRIYFNCCCFKALADATLGEL